MSGYGQSYLGISQEMSSPKVLLHPRELHTGHSGRWMSFKACQKNEHSLVIKYFARDATLIQQFVTLYEFIFLLLSSMLVKLSPAGEVNLLTWVCIIKVLSEYQTSIVWVLADLLEYSVTVASGQSQKNIQVHITRPDQHRFFYQHMFNMNITQNWRHRIFSAGLESALTTTAWQISTLNIDLFKKLGLDLGSSGMDDSLLGELWL